MTPQQIRTAEPNEVAKFPDEGRNVEQAHLRLALANALEWIAKHQNLLARHEERLPRKLGENYPRAR
jgi:hypothetical protein